MNIQFFFCVYIKHFIYIYIYPYPYLCLCIYCVFFLLVFTLFNNVSAQSLEIQILDNMGDGAVGARLCTNDGAVYIVNDSTGKISIDEIFDSLFLDRTSFAQAFTRTW